MIGTMANNENDAGRQGGEAAAASSTATGGGDWRQSIAQSYRSEEVRSIADVLAGLEPGATSASKKMLAMKFEDAIFKAASSMDDYRKTIEKRLNRLKKKYAGAGGTEEENADLIREKVLLFQNSLQKEYGPRLMYVVKHADHALEISRQKNGEKQTKVLKDHCDHIKKRALQLGVKLEGITPLPRVHHDMQSLTQLKSYLDKTLESVRSHILKNVDVDLFMMEKLDNVDDILLKMECSKVLRKAVQEEYAGGDIDDTQQFTVDRMKNLMEIMNAPTPIPRRNQNADQIRAALSLIEKIRAGTKAMLTYLGLTLEEKTSFPGSIKKCAAIMRECWTALDKDYGNLFEVVEEKDQDGNPIIKLEDAWNKHLQYLDDTEQSSTEDVDEDAITTDEPAKKRQKTEVNLRHSSTEPPNIVISARVLLTPGRKVFSTVIPALKRKRAQLIKNGSVSSIRLEFGNAFEMNIYFKPLLVTIRAMTKETTATSGRGLPALSGGIQWASPHQGLYSSFENPDNTARNKVSLLGVTGTSATLAPIIAKNLEYASAQATYVLRKCFAETVTGKSAFAKTEFDIEILEAGALVKFLKMVRSTYHSGKWVDVED